MYTCVIVKKKNWHAQLCSNFSGIAVNGLIVRTKRPKATTGNFQTYFGQMGVKAKNVTILISPSRIKINKDILDWKLNKTLHVDGVKITISRKKNVTISLGHGLKFAFIRHRIAPTHRTMVSYLGFYVLDGRMLAWNTHGLMGKYSSNKINLEFRSWHFFGILRLYRDKPVETGGGN